MKYTLKCHHCGEMARKVGGEVIYPHRKDLYDLKFYYCDNGHDPAYVGTHRGNRKPLGTLANSEERAARSEAHRAFDPIWKYRERGNRTQQSRREGAYAKLAEYMGLPKRETHIGMFNVEQCAKVVEFSRSFEGLNK